MSEDPIVIHGRHLPWDDVVEISTAGGFWRWPDTPTFSIRGTDTFGVIRVDDEPVRMPGHLPADEWTEIPGHPTVQVRIMHYGALNKLWLRRTPPTDDA